MSFEKNNMEKNTEELFEIEETIDFEKLRKENRKKYREVYLQVEKLGSRPHQIIDKAELKKLQNKDLYYDALKTGFFIEKYAEKLKNLTLDKETAESIKRDVDMVSEKDKSKYEDLLYWIEYNKRREHPNSKELLKYLIFAIVGTLIVSAFLILGVFTRKAIFFLICVILLCIFSGVAVFIRMRWLINPN